ncbi:hypothetical protein Tco_0554723 [Tanacetum coccineum]
MPLRNLVSNLALKACFKNLIPWEKKIHLQNRLTWISIEGLPPHAWHEAAFTHIAGTWGEVIFPETCNKNANNLVAGKVCIRTKCMEVIQHNMPVVIDEGHFCVRIKEIMGECDEVLSDEKTIVSKSDEDYSSSNDDSSGKEVVHSEEDDDDFYDDGSDYNFFTDEVNEIQGGGGWIRNDVGDTKDISYPQSSKSDNIQNGMLLRWKMKFKSPPLVEAVIWIPSCTPSQTRILRKSHHVHKASWTNMLLTLLKKEISDFL